MLREFIREREKEKLADYARTMKRLWMYYEQVGIPQKIGTLMLRDLIRERRRKKIADYARTMNRL